MEPTRTCAACGAVNRIPLAHLADRGRCGRCREALPPLAEPLDVDAAAFDEIVRTARVPILVDFWASWCAPCRMAAPEVARAARERAGHAIVLKVDTEREPSLAARFGVRGIPSFLVLRDGKPVVQQAGVVGSRQLVAWLDQAAGGPARTQPENPGIGAPS